MEHRHEESLDGFRTIAVSLVIIHHWFPSDLWYNNLSLGMVGVTMFFTLSGFLITGILLRNKESGQRVGTIFKNFYIRRSLRIFPIYYLFVFALFATGCFKSMAYFISCLTYTSNFYVFVINKWPDFAGHTWSLAVEEQFYLIWPFVLLFSKANTRNLLLFFVGLGIASRIVFVLLCSPESLHAVLTPNCFDCFALGGVLAYYTRTYSEGQKKSLTYKLNLAALISLVFYICEMMFNSPALHITERLYVSLMSAAVINMLFNGHKSVLKTVLSFSPMVYLGKISYAIYLYHGISISLYKYLQKQMDVYHLYIPFTHHTLLPWVGGNKQMVLYFGFLILICSLSWYLIEKPLNSFKKHFS